MSKAVRKDYFGWQITELETWLPLLLENMRFSDIKVQFATRKATAVAKDAVSLPSGRGEIRSNLTITWTQQSEGLTFIVTVEELTQEWTSCIVNRMADNVIGALRTVCEAYHGKDA